MSEPVTAPEQAPRERVVRILAEQVRYTRPSGLTAAEIGDHQRIIEDLGFDGLDCAEAVMGLEEEFGVDILDEIAEGWHTVGDVVRWAEGVADGR